MLKDFTKPDINSILATFSKTVEKLEKAQAWYNEEVIKQTSIMEAAKLAADNAGVEAYRASKIKAKIEAIIS